MNTLANESARISAIKFNGYKIELDTNVKGRPVARSYRLLTAGKNKGQYKLIEGYYFNDEQRREEWVKGKIADFKSRVNDKEQQANAKKEIRENMQHGFEVGQVYYSSWGYDQTNVDFYEVLEVKGKSVLIQEIGATMQHTEGYSSMAAMVIPDTENKVSDPVWRQIQFYLDNTNKPNFYIKMPKYSGRYSLYLYTKSDKGVYCSWYA